MQKSVLTFSVVLFGILFLSGCTSNFTDPDMDFEPPKYVEQMPAYENKADHVSTGSIFGQGDNPLFSDHKAMHVNDIVRVTISESARSSNSGTKQLTEADEGNLGGGLFAADGAGGSVAAIATKLNGISNVGFTTKSDSTFTGKSSASKDATFTTTISVRIVKVLENGNYFIAGKREILVDDQKQVIQLSGVIRPYDIDQYNVISSTQVSEAKILYKTQGDVDRATKQGWGSEIVKAVWPF